VPDTAVPAPGATAVAPPVLPGAHLIVAANGRARQAAGRPVVGRDPVDVERLFALIGRSRQHELVDHSPAAPPAPVLDGVWP
jgi:hypothetical protein